jgi:hypothetical protein
MVFFIRCMHCTQHMFRIDLGLILVTPSQKNGRKKKAGPERNFLILLLLLSLAGAGLEPATSGL